MYLFTNSFLKTRINTFFIKLIVVFLISGKYAVFYFFNVWLNRSQLDSHISFCIQSFVTLPTTHYVAPG